MRLAARNIGLALLFAGLLAGAPGAAGLAKADRVSPHRSHPGHMSRAPERPSWRMKKASVKKRTIYENAAKRGLILLESRGLRQVAAFDRPATEACRKGNFRRFGGGIARIGGRTYRAARAPDIRRSPRVAVENGVYVFSHEGSTRCKVFLLAGR